MVPRTRAFRNPGVAERRDIQHITELTDRPNGYAVGPVLLYWHIRNAFSASWKVSICSLSL